MGALERVLAVPGNGRVLERLRALLGSGQAIAFVGAGASVPLYPLWQALIRLLANEAVDQGLADDVQRTYWLSRADKNPQQVVRGIRDALGERMFAAVIERTFGYRVEGPWHTPTHAALLALPFRGYATTNYDPGLIEARRLVRPDVRATGYATWKDPDPLHKWLTGEAFGAGSCPILYAHGVFERTSDTVVLGAGEYRDAYQPGLFQRVVDKLWSQERLVFVGFGFSDAWFGVVADQVLTPTAHQASGEPRHVAVLGLRDDEPYSAEIRHEFRDAYDADVLLYPVAVAEDGGEDHGLLFAVLDELRGSVLPAEVTFSLPATAPEPRGPAAPQRWAHETTEDDRYTEPAGALDWLDRWAADPSVRAIAVTGIGGLGKTALLGHWLKREGGASRRPNQGLLFWSFNADRSVEGFLDALLGFATEELGLEILVGRKVDAAVAVLRGTPLVVVLDGLEVLQERPGDATAEEPGRFTYGEFLEADLRELLDVACRDDHGGLVLLTSRFPFTDLDGFLGTSLRRLALNRLNSPEGAALLARSGVGGSEEDRREVARGLNGHPLALRVFAAALAREPHADPIRLAEAVFGALHEDDTLEGKLVQLLDFYEAQLPLSWRALLGIVALFPDQVPLGTVTQFARELCGAKDCLEGHSDAQLRADLDALSADGLLVREYGFSDEEVYACHPVVRAHFRAMLIGGDPANATRAADLLTSALIGQVETLEQARAVTTAIGLLLDAGEVEQAEALYQERLVTEGASLFRHLAWAREGLSCALLFVGDDFVGDDARRDQVRERGHLPLHLNRVGIFARNAAELELADRFYRARGAIAEGANDRKNLSLNLRNQAELLTDLGRLAEAEAAARQALKLDRDIDNAKGERNALSRLAVACDRQGRVAEALKAFKDADAIERQEGLEGASLFYLGGIWYVDLLLRFGWVAEARERTEANLQICEHYGWGQNVARCRWLLGRLDTLAGAFDTAAEHLTAAEATFRGGRMLAELPPVLLAQADLARRRRDWIQAERYVGEALGLAAPRRMRLHHADALVLRGRITLDRVGSEGAERALDDAEAARSLAQGCGYAWAERDATALLADAHAALGDDQRAHRHRKDAQTLTRRLQLPG
ncbi:MAG: SIR2 family protein [Egibacteraceae bacterium]